VNKDYQIISISISISVNKDFQIISIATLINLLLCTVSFVFDRLILSKLKNNSKTQMEV